MPIDKNVKPEFSIVLGDSEHILKDYPENTFHACITDPPYGMGMRKGVRVRVPLRAQIFFDFLWIC